MADWYQLDEREVLEQLRADPESGLSDAEAKRRAEEHGPNELIERGVKNPWRILWEQLTGVMVLILIIAAGVSIALRDYEDAIAILAIVVLNAALGFAQEYRAEKAMAALRRMAVPAVHVRRDGRVREISSRRLVPGDVVLLEAGNLVPADGRLIETANLQTQEAALTGESAAVDKDPAALQQADLPLGDRRNMVYRGTVVTYGRGEFVVTETGMATEIGRIAEMLQTVRREPTPLQQRLAQLGRGLAVAALAIVAVVFLMGVLRGEDTELMLMTAMSMAVAAVPEGLPAVVTVALALGSRRMLARKALIRKLPAVETLGSVTVICSDKTGTLTENRMTVTVIDIAGHRIDLGREEPDQRPSGVGAPLSRQPSIAMLLAGGTLCNNAVLADEESDASELHTLGDPTEGALVEAAQRVGLAKGDLERVLPRVAEVPFTSERKRMTTAHRIEDPEARIADGTVRELFGLDQTAAGCFLAITKGAVDSLLEVSTHVRPDAGDKPPEPLDDSRRQRIAETNDQLARDGMRVLGIAVRRLAELPDEPDEQTLERELVFIGLVGMIDPPRPEVKQAVETCKQAGVRPIMITGDHPLTAQFIARELDIGGDRVLTGRDMARMSVEELEEIVEDVSVYARVSPEHKLKIVQALQDQGHVVAMTGDGVNDAPALRKADIGIAMGVTGTDVSKDAADMVLVDDNFATIVAAVHQGRVIYDNIRKFIKYTMSSNAGEIWVMLLAPLVGMPLPLLPLQILWINLVTDGLPGLALAVEPPERGVMQRPPHSPNENIFARGMARQIVWVGLLMGLVSLAVGYWAGDGDWPTGGVWQTMVFTTLTLSQMGNALAMRSERDSLFRIGILSNKMMLGAVALTFVLQLAVVYVPFLQGVFRTRALSITQLALCVALSTPVFWAFELEKRLLRRRKSS